MQAAGGIQPWYWGFVSSWWMGINLDQSTGVFSGYSSITGTLSGTVGLIDATGYGDSQTITVAVTTCLGHFPD